MFENVKIPSVRNEVTWDTFKSGDIAITPVSKGLMFENVKIPSVLNEFTVSTFMSGDTAITLVRVKFPVIVGWDPASSIGIFI